MDSTRDKRALHALRKHIDGLLDAGAVITSRDPLTVLSAGETLKVKHGMLVGYTDILALIEPVTDHEWPESLRQMAVDLCVKQLDQAIEALNRSSVIAEVHVAANASSITG